MKTNEPSYFSHHFLIAMPHLQDPNFARTVVYLIEHTDVGAMGLVINRETELTLCDVLQQIHPKEAVSAHCHAIPIYAGGPLHTDRGFVLHPQGEHFQSTVDLGELAMTTSHDILSEIAAQRGPSRFLIALGYASWEMGQLEREICDNAWLVCPARPEVLFDVPLAERLTHAAALLGVDWQRLSSAVGHA